MHYIESHYNRIQSTVQQAYDEAGKFLDRHPAVYKIVLFACHLFRTLAMIGVMLWLPLPLPATMAIMFAGTLLYRAAVERFCCFRFAIPSMAGACAALFAQASLVNIIADAALSTLGKVLCASLAFLPLLGYIAWAAYLSHRDFENRPKNSCCQS